MTVAFSFDIEEHHRIEAAVAYECPLPLKHDYAQRMETCTRWLLDVLAEFNAKATFFVVGEIAVTHPTLIQDMAKAGHEVASHSWDHRRVHRFTPETFREDVRRSQEALENVTGVKVVGFRAPTFSVMRETAWAIDVLAECGMQYDSSIFPVRHDRYGVPEAPRFPFVVRGATQSLLELPPLTYGVGSYNLPVAGGGYFRLFPPQVMRAGIRQTLAQPTGQPVLYFHPWEFDPTQPHLPLKRLSRFRTYVGIRRSRGRLRRLLARYGSVRMIDRLAVLDRATLPTFTLT